MTTYPMWGQSSLSAVVSCSDSCQCVEELQETVQHVQARHRKQEVEWKQEMTRLTQEVAWLTQEVAKQKEAVEAGYFVVFCAT